MKQSVVRILFISISGILLFFAGKTYYNSYKLVNNGQKTKAKVIELIEERSSDDDGFVYKPVFEYNDKNQKLVTFKSPISSNPPSYEVGEVVEVVYTPDNKEHKVVSFLELYSLSLFLAVFGFILGSIGLYYKSN